MELQGLAIKHFQAGGGMLILLHPPLFSTVMDPTDLKK